MVRRARRAPRRRRRRPRRTRARRRAGPRRGPRRAEDAGSPEPGGWCASSGSGRRTLGGLGSAPARRFPPGWPRHRGTHGERWVRWSPRWRAVPAVRWSPRWRFGDRRTHRVRPTGRRRGEARRAVRPTRPGCHDRGPFRSGSREPGRRADRQRGRAEGVAGQAPRPPRWDCIPRWPSRSGGRRAAVAGVGRARVGRARGIGRPVVVASWRSGAVRARPPRRLVPPRIRFRVRCARLVASGRLDRWRLVAAARAPRPARRPRARIPVGVRRVQLGPVVGDRPPRHVGQHHRRREAPPPGLGREGRRMGAPPPGHQDRPRHRHRA